MRQYSSVANDATPTNIDADILPVLEYWQQGCKGQFAPTWQDFRLEELPPRLIPQCAVVDVIDDGDDFCYRFWGTDREVLQGRDMTGKSVRELCPSDLTDLVWEEYAEILKRRNPIWFEITAHIDDSHEFQFQYLRMPLRGDGQNIDRIFGICRNRYSPRELESTFPIT
ncbi:MAG: PAS domain-containing protein [Rhodospirillaceae bacterium]|nr:PAS domain-containing protein [Rhodospirillaceae bacterium]